MVGEMNLKCRKLDIVENLYLAFGHEHRFLRFNRFLYFGT